MVVDEAFAKVFVFVYHLFSVNFEIVPVILDLGFPGFDSKPIEEYVASLGLKLIVHDSKEVFQILDSARFEQKLNGGK